MHGAEMIPDEAVEAAAQGIWQHYETHAASNSAEPSDEDRAVARAALEAAAPYIRAEALRTAATHLEYGNPVGSWLENRADEIEAIYAV